MLYRRIGTIVVAVLEADSQNLIDVVMQVTHTRHYLTPREIYCINRLPSGPDVTSSFDPLLDRPFTYLPVLLIRSSLLS
jgi:hypothetical protein